LPVPAGPLITISIAFDRHRSTAAPCAL